MSKIWITSDLHLSHIQPFVWEARGFTSPDHMNEEIIKRWNELVNDEDEVWILGDLVMNDNEKGAAALKQLKGHIHVVCGNHCTDTRIAIYKKLGYDVHFAYRLKYKKKSFYLSHYPTLTGNGEDKCWLATWNLHGHTHSTSRWCEHPFCYNVNMDAHDCRPVLLDNIIEEINAHWKNLEIGTEGKK